MFTIVASLCTFVYNRDQTKVQLDVRIGIGRVCTVKNAPQSAKFGRNYLCWCGSGKKYKHCHLNRTEPFRPYEASKVTKQRLNKGSCLHPDAGSHTCSQFIIKAHSIQKNGSLNRIADDGHVYTFYTGYGKLKGWLGDPKRISIHDASTFRGFCQHHDSVTFAPIERNPFQVNTHHAFLLAYRALCHELYNKQAGLDLLPSLREKVDGGLPLREQEVRQKTISDLIITISSVVRTLTYYKSTYDQALQANDFTQTSYYIVRFSNTPEFLCSGSLIPLYDFSGRILQDGTPRNVIYDHVTFSLIATDSGGAVVFSWLGKSKAAEQLIQSFHALSDAALPHAIVRYTFELIENIFVSPLWWEALREEAKRMLRFRQITPYAFTGKSRSANCLLDDGLRAVNWNIILRRTNCYP